MHHLRRGIIRSIDTILIFIIPILLIFPSDVFSLPEAHHSHILAIQTPKKGSLSQFIQIARPRGYQPLSQTELPFVVGSRKYFSFDKHPDPLLRKNQSTGQYSSFYQIPWKCVKISKNGTSFWKIDLDKKTSSKPKNLSDIHPSWVGLGIWIWDEAPENPQLSYKNVDNDKLDQHHFPHPGSDQELVNPILLPHQELKTRFQNSARTKELERQKYLRENYFGHEWSWQFQWIPWSRWRTFQMWVEPAKWQAVESDLINLQIHNFQDIQSIMQQLVDDQTKFSSSPMWQTQLGFDFHLSTISYFLKYLMIPFQLEFEQLNPTEALHITSLSVLSGVKINFLNLPGAVHSFSLQAALLAGIGSSQIRLYDDQLLHFENDLILKSRPTKFILPRLSLSLRYQGRDLNNVVSENYQVSQNEFGNFGTNNWTIPISFGWEIGLYTSREVWNWHRFSWREREVPLNGSLKAIHRGFLFRVFVWL